MRVEKVSLNGGGSSESTETVDAVGDYFYLDNSAPSTIDDSINYSKSSMDTMKMAGLSKFSNKKNTVRKMF